jgi:hypothetical protein
MPNGDGMRPYVVSSRTPAGRHDSAMWDVNGGRSRKEGLPCFCGPAHLAARSLLISSAKRSKNRTTTSYVKM